jgi:hypothetical protein
MVAIAFCAFLLALAVWNLRQLEALRNERLIAEHARVLAEERAVALARSAQAPARLTTADQKKAGTLWAGLSVNHPIFRVDHAKDLRIELTLVNDGDKVIDPKISESHLVINGKELPDSGLILGGVQKDARIKALSPGESLLFDRPVGDRFKEPGTYHVAWKGAGFQSPEIVIRILPDRAH